MKLIEHEELQPLHVLDNLPIELILPRHEQLKHHEVREDDIRRIGRHLLALAVLFLTGVARECRLQTGIKTAMLDEFFKLLALGIGEGVHRIDDDRSCPARLASPPRCKDPVDDGHKEAERFARTGTCRDDVVTALQRLHQRLLLMQVQADWGARRAKREDGLEIAVDHALPCKFGDRTPALELRVEPDQRLGPELTPLINSIDLAPEIFSADRGKRTRELLVSGDQISIEFENVHDNPLSTLTIIAAIARIAAGNLG